MEDVKIINEIANIIVNNRAGLIKKLDELGIACSCSLFDVTEKDLSEIVIDNIENKELSKWITKKILLEDYSNVFVIDDAIIAGAIILVSTIVGASAKSAQAKKQRAFEYKKILTEKAIELRRQQEEQKAKAKQKETTIIMIASLSLLSIGALFYIVSTRKINNT